MRIIKTKDYLELSKKAANIIGAEIIYNPNCVLGLATGATPIETYKNLVQSYTDGNLDFSNVKSINLDEYKGLSKESDQSYFYYMQKNLFQHVNIDLNNVYLPDGTIEDEEEVCKAYDAIIDTLGGQDLQLLGLGHNGHIGFNEPSDCFEKNTHCVKLAPSTIEANKRFFDTSEDVPKHAYTMGIGSIMKAKKILLLVSGQNKAEIVKEAFFGPITPRVPASILQLHSNVILIVDEAAGSLL
ncbi:MAG: glucosamine-6-phosphate deaminase [Lachnospiraceae bacterium]